MAATPVLISVAEYLSSVYRPDCDYIDGEVKERNLGEKPHSKLQGFFCWYFRSRHEAWNVLALPEQRVQVAAHRYRIPDVCLIAADATDELIIRTPPMLCIEILSREDRMSDILERVDDYLRMGVPAVWIVDPWRIEARSVARDGTMRRELETLLVPNTPIKVPVEAIFRELQPRG